MPKREESPKSPLSPYAASKLAAAEFCRAFYHTYGLETVVLRYFNVFGPRQDPGSQYAALIPRFISAVLAGRPPVIYGDGRQSRDFTYVSNVVEANLLAATAPGAAGRPFNIACGERVEVREVLRQVCGLLGRPCEPRYEPDRPGDVRHSLADITAARECLGYQPRVRFSAGLARTVAAFTSDAGTPFETRAAVATA